MRVPVRASVRAPASLINELPLYRRYVADVLSCDTSHLGIVATRTSVFMEKLEVVPRVMPHVTGRRRRRQVNTVFRKHRAKRVKTNVEKRTVEQSKGT